MLLKKKISLIIMIVVYLAAGINHFINPAFYKSIMPPWLPYHNALIFISGLAEILLAILLIPKSTRRMAAWGIILLLVAVFPANIYMAIRYFQENNPLLVMAIVRLPLQLLLIAWAYSFSHKLEIKHRYNTYITNY